MHMTSCSCSACSSLELERPGRELDRTSKLHAFDGTLQHGDGTWHVKTSVRHHHNQYRDQTEPHFPVTMRAPFTASRRLVRSCPLSTISSSALTRHDVPVSSVVPPNFTNGRLIEHTRCYNHNQRLLSSSAASKGNDDDDISIKSQATAEDMLLSKYTQITESVLKSATGSISDKLRHEALEAASYWTRQQTAESADRAAEIFHHLYDEQDAHPQVNIAPPIELVAYCIDVFRLHSGSSFDKPSEGTLADKAEALLTQAEKHSSSLSAASDDDDNHLTTQVYNMVLDAYSKVGDHEACDRMLKHMDERCVSDPLAMIHPDAVSYNILLKALSNSKSPDSPMRSEEVLQRMQNMADAGDGDVAPTAASFATVISCWGRSSQLDGPSRAEDILLRMLELYKAGRSELKPNVVCFGAVLDAWAKSGAPESAKRADDIVQLMTKELGNDISGDETMEHSDSDSDGDYGSVTALASAFDAISKPGQGFDDTARRLVRAMGSSANAITFTVLIDSFARSESKDAGAKAEAVLLEMIRLNEGGNNNMRPTKATWNAVMNAHSKSGERDAGERAIALLNRMKDMHVSGSSSDIKPDSTSFSTCIDALGNSGDRNAGYRAEELLAEMDELHRVGDESMRPSLICYSAAISAWARSRAKDAGHRAEALLERMQEMYSKGDEQIKPNEQCYGAVLDAYAKGGDSSNAERFLSKLEMLYEAGDEAADPRRQNYINSVIDSIVRSRQKDAPDRCMALLKRMKEKYDLEPCVRTRNSLINAVAKAGKPNSAEKAESMLLEMLHTNREDLMPSTVTFNICIDAWSRSRSPDAPKRAERLLNQMRELNSKGFTFIKPDVVSYSACISAWGRSRDENGAERSEQILSHMQSLYEATGDEDLRPNIVSLSAVVSAWASRAKGNPSAAQRAHDILEWANRRGIKPNTVTFNSVITALSRSGQKDSAHKGHDLLDRMKRLYREGDLDVKPSRVTYNSVISCYASSPPSNAMEKVDALLDEMKQLAVDESDDRPSVTPDVVTYGSYLGCLAKSRVPDKAQRAHKIILEMEEEALAGNDNIRPNVLIYDQTLRSCAFTNTKDAKFRRQALKVAVAVLTKIRDDASNVEPLPNTYDLCVWACCGLTRGEELARLLERIFQMCCEDGCLSDQVLRRLRTMAPPGVVRSLIGDETKTRAFPDSWSRNAKRTGPDMKSTRQHVRRERELRGERRSIDTRQR